VSSLGLDLDGESTGAGLAVRMISSGNKSCGTFITPFISGKYRPTPIKLNVHYQWTLNYDPAANHGNGRFQFVIRGDGTKPEEFEGKTFSVDVPAVIRKEGATFDRFGRMNMGRAGNPLSIYFDDLEYDGMKQDFSRVPNWEGVGNRVSYPERDHPGLQNFGFSADTSFAGGRPGEIGGTFWRTERNPGYYADRIGRLTLNEPLEARGKVIMQIGTPDSGMCLGWFNSAANDIPRHNKDYLGVEIGGPTRIGHYFSPRCATADGTTRKVDKAPILVPGKIYAWSISYDPSANGNNGAVCVTLGSESVTLDLNPGDKARGATFDCFGLASTSPGGGILKIYFDDLLYTAGR
jgi:hypothetical protein